MVKGVFFDLGGTLYSYKKYGAATITVAYELARRFDIEAESREIVHQYQIACKDADKHYVGKNFYLFREYFKAIFSNFLNRYDRQYSSDDFDWFNEFHSTTLINCLELKHDCHTMLDALKSRNLYLSVVSNIDENMLHPLIDKASLHQWLDHWTSSEAAQSCKPDPRFFEIALEKAGLSAEEVIFVGDSLEQDIQGAHDVGMSTVLISEDDCDVPMHVGKETVEPDYRIAELRMLVDIIDNQDK